LSILRFQVDRVLGEKASLNDHELRCLASPFVERAALLQRASLDFSCGPVGAVEVGVG
jgi:hypothetical protein